MPGKSSGTTKGNFTATFSNTDHIREELKHRQDMQKIHHDRTAHDLPPLLPGEDVRILDN